MPGALVQHIMGLCRYLPTILSQLRVSASSFLDGFSAVSGAPKGGRKGTGSGHVNIGRWRRENLGFGSDIPIGLFPSIGAVGARRSRLPPPPIIIHSDINSAASSNVNANVPFASFILQNI